MPTAVIISLATGGPVPPVVEVAQGATAASINLPSGAKTRNLQSGVTSTVLGQGVKSKVIEPDH